MELYYFVSGIIIAAVGFLLYEFRYVIARQKKLLADNKIIADRLNLNSDNLTKIIEKMSEDNYADAAQMNSNLAALKTQIDGVSSDLNSLAKQHGNLVKKTDNDKLELVQNFRSGIEQLTNNRQY